MFCMASEWYSVLSLGVLNSALRSGLFLKLNSHWSLVTIGFSCCRLNLRREIPPLEGVPSQHAGITTP